MLSVQSSDLPSKVLILIKIIVLKFLFGVLDSNLVLKKKFLRWGFEVLIMGRILKIWGIKLKFLGLKF